MQEDPDSTTGLASTLGDSWPASLPSPGLSVPLHQMGRALPPLTSVTCYCHPSCSPGLALNPCANFWKVCDEDHANCTVPTYPS